MFDSTQTRNGKAVLQVVSQRALARRWTIKQAVQHAWMVIACGLAESGLRIYANPNVPDSMNLPHDAVGHDHASVGIFQQQVPMWGSAHDCMDPAISCGKFLDALSRKNLDGENAGPLYMRIQWVQVSAFADGSNYHRQNDAANAFVSAHWYGRHMTVK